MSGEGVPRSDTDPGREDTAMTDQDIEARRKRDLERYYRQTAERRAQGLCIKCGKRPPTPHRTWCEPCAAKKRPADRARHHRRTAERVDRGLCPKCGKVPPAPGRSQCEPCLEKDRVAGRARDARLRARGKPRRNPAKTREYERKRSRRQTEARRAEGVCTACGKAPAAPGRASCEPCLEQRRAGDRARYAAGKAAGKLYGGADAETKRRAGRARSRQRKKAWCDAGLCVRCGTPPAVEGRTICTSCREKLRAKARRQYAERRAAGLCTKCGTPAFDGLTYCGPCAVIRNARRPPERKNEAARLRYAERRARGLCTDCAEPSQGAARCMACAERSYHRSAHFRGIPIWDPTWTVIEIATGQEHGPFDSEADVALCLAFEKLRHDQVEVVNDASPMSAYTSWT